MRSPVLARVVPQSGSGLTLKIQALAQSAKPTLLPPMVSVTMSDSGEMTGSSLVMT